MNWAMSFRAAARARRLADRHYNRQSVGAAQFVPPGRCLVLLTPEADAYWVTSWPFAEFVHHAWGGAWMCSAFRNEGSEHGSTLIREAVACTRTVFGEPPPLGMVTFVDPAKVRAKRDPGHVYVIAGFRPCGTTKGGLLAFQMTPERMPEPAEPLGFARRLFA